MTEEINKAIRINKIKIELSVENKELLSRANRFTQIDGSATLLLMTLVAYPRLIHTLSMCLRSSMHTWSWRKPPRPFRTLISCTPFPRTSLSNDKFSQSFHHCSEPVPLGSSTFILIVTARFWSLLCSSNPLFIDSTQ